MKKVEAPNWFCLFQNGWKVLPIRYRTFLKTLVAIDQILKRKIMNTHADKTRENKSQTVANVTSRIQSNGENTFQFVDNRRTAIAQRKLQKMVDNSTQVKQAVQLQAIANKDFKQRKSRVPVIQRVTDLKIQQGPSCWLFVLEAIAKSKGVSTKYLSMAMEAYPSSEKAVKKKKKEAQEGNEISKRAAALELITESCTEMIAKLHNWKVGEGGNRASRNIERRIVERYARQTLDSEASVSHIIFDDVTNSVHVDIVINE